MYELQLLELWLLYPVPFTNADLLPVIAPFSGCTAAVALIITG